MRVGILSGLLGLFGALAMAGGAGRPAEDPFRAFHRQHNQAVARHVARRVPARTVDDAVQKVFVLAWQKGLHRLSVPAEARAALIGLVQGVCRNERRSDRRRLGLGPVPDKNAPAVTAQPRPAPVVGPDTPAPDVPDPGVFESRLQSREMLDRLVAEIDLLSPELGEAFELFYVDELPIPQIARLLGATEAAIKKRLQRGREEILARWSKLPQEVPP